jgi:hypothetical protein
MDGAEVMESLADGSLPDLHTLAKHFTVCER